MNKENLTGRLFTNFENEQERAEQPRHHTRKSLCIVEPTPQFKDRVVKEESSEEEDSYSYSFELPAEEDSMEQGDVMKHKKLGIRIVYDGK